MSWDVLFQPLPPGVRSIAEIPEDFAPGALCTRAELIEKVRAIAPMVDFRDPAWGVIEGDDFSIEINVGDEDPVGGFMLHVRGSDGALGVIRLLSEALGCAPIDCSEGELLDLHTPDVAAGLRAWRAFRDGVAGDR